MQLFLQTLAVSMILLRVCLLMQTVNNSFEVIYGGAPSKGLFRFPPLVSHTDLEWNSCA